MPPDDTLCQEVQAWLDKSSSDLRAAEILLAADPGLTGNAMFHCQQAAEKAIKGFLVWHGQKFRKTHSIEEVGEQALTIDPSLAPLIDQAAPLSLYAWKFRYPGDTFEPSVEKARQTLAIARQVYAEVVQRLPEQAHPKRHA